MYLNIDRWVMNMLFKQSSFACSTVMIFRTIAGVIFENQITMALIYSQVVGVLV